MAAEEAKQQAEQLTSRTREDAVQQVAAAEETRRQASTATRDAVRYLKSDSTGVDLQGLPKRELLELAAAKDLDGRSRMSKAQLVTALKRSSR